MKLKFKQMSKNNKVRFKILPNTIGFEIARQNVIFHKQMYSKCVFEYWDIANSSVHKYFPIFMPLFSSHLGLDDAD